MHPAPTDLVGRTVGPYELERLLGQGGFAWVFVGRELDGTPVAVKILKPRYGADPAFEIRFRNEAETAAKLDHPNIIRIRFVARSGGYVYFAMDLCADSLGARLAREGPLIERDVVRLATDVARGLDFAHRQGVIHRDLKPDNILIHSDGSAVISDFGIAALPSEWIRMLSGFRSRWITPCRCAKSSPRATSVARRTTSRSLSGPSRARRAPSESAHRSIAKYT